MTRSGRPTQSQVLRERSSRVPWRRAILDAVRDRTGNGRTVLPARLEGAVYGQLVGDALGPAAAAGDRQTDQWSADGAAMLALLEALLGQRSHRADPTTLAEPGSPARVLPVPLVRRDADPDETADLAARASGASGEAASVAALYALVVRRFVAGERGREGVLGRAVRDLRSGPGRPGRDAAVRGFWSGWEAFAGSAGYQEAVTRALASDPADRLAASIAGGLAGAYWGDSAIPPSWRRRLPEERVARSLVDRLVETDAPGWDGLPWRTSTASPVRVDSLDLSGLDDAASGAVGITFLPGRRYVGYHTGAHWRDLETDAARLGELGVDALFLLVEDHELVRCRVTGIGEALAAHGVDLVRFPIRDPLLPRDRAAFHRAIVRLVGRVRAGGSIAVACRGGLDRAGMAAACLLREAGLDADEAIDRVQRARRGALTLPDQQAYVRGWPPGR